MTDKEKIDKLKKIIDDTIWMSVRYAHGRHTYAPGMVRDAVIRMKEMFPDWMLKEDKTIEPPNHEPTGIESKSDYLHDLFE